MYIFFSIILILSFYYFFLDSFIQRILLYTCFENLLFELERSKQLVWNKIFREKIYPHQLGMYKLNKEELDNISAEYVLLVVQNLGPKILEDLVKIKGSEESIWIELAGEFSHRIINTEIQNIDEKIGSEIIKK